MQRTRNILLSLAALGAVGLFFDCGTEHLFLPQLAQAEEDGHAIDAAGEQLPTTVAEARARARILHETVHGALQVMHRDFFREDEGLIIPSHSLEDVFRELARSQHVKLRWLVVNADAMNIDNKPKTEFEKRAAKALASGEQAYESITQDSYSYAGTIRLSSQCLKCHVPRRTSTEDRAAGLVILVPLQPQ